MAVESLLPPPGASPREVFFRRLLLQCSKLISSKEQQEQQQLQQPQVLADWQKDPKLHAQVQLLKDRLFDLEKSKDCPSPNILSSYWAEVNAAAAALRPLDLPPYCRNLAVADPFGQGPAAAGPNPPAPTTSASSSSSSLASSAQQAAGTPLRPSAAAAASASQAASSSPSRATAAAAGGGSGGAVHWSDEAKRRIQTQAALQAELGDELLGMTAALREGALAMQSAIRHRGTALDSTELHLVNSAANAAAVAAGAKRQYRASRLGMCQTCLLLLGLVGVLLFMVVFIRVTSAVGLGRR